MGDFDSTLVSGVEVGGYRAGAASTDPWWQRVVPVKDYIVSFRGRAGTFLTPGRATVGQKLLALHNATGSSIFVNVNRVRIDLLTTVAKAATIVPPIIRVQRFTAVPSAGTALAKTGLDTGLSSNAAVTAWGDASADGTSSGTTLAVTVTSGVGILGQAWAPRLIQSTAVGISYEPLDTVEFFIGEPDIVLRALEGVVVWLDQAVVTTGNPITDRWLAVIDWEEYTRP